MLQYQKHIIFHSLVMLMFGKKNDSGDMEINYLLPMDNVCCDKINDKSVTEEEE